MIYLVAEKGALRRGHSDSYLRVQVSDDEVDSWWIHVQAPDCGAKLARLCGRQVFRR